MTATELAQRVAEALEQVLPLLPTAVSDDPCRFTEIPDHTMTAEEVGELRCIRRSEKRVRELAGDGVFPGAYQLGNTWMFPPECVRLYLRRLQEETAEDHDFDHEVNAGGQDHQAYVVRHIVTTEHPRNGGQLGPMPAVMDDAWDPDSEMEFDAYKEEFDD